MYMIIMCIYIDKFGNIKIIFSRIIIKKKLHPLASISIEFGLIYQP
jgi:hypothetical protein